MTVEKPNEEYLRPDEVAKKLRVSVKTVRRWTNDGKIEHVRTPGKGIRIPKRELEKLIKIMKASYSVKINGI